MSLVKLVLLLVLAPIGVALNVWLVGWCGTVKCRLEHKREMFKLAEQAKANAITIDERRMAMLDHPSWQRSLG